VEFQLDFFAVVPLVVESAKAVATSLFEGDVVVEDDAGSLDVASVAVAEHDFLFRCVAAEVDGVVDECFRRYKPICAVEFVDVDERWAAHQSAPPWTTVI